jgi:hypothetical protein
MTVLSDAEVAQHQGMQPLSIPRRCRKMGGPSCTLQVYGLDFSWLPLLPQRHSPYGRFQASGR